MRLLYLAASFSLYFAMTSAQGNHSALPPSPTTRVSALTTNNTSSYAGPFPFIIPYSQSQECDIFGPICQTGLITVGVSLGVNTTTSTLPCSSYLTAQADYLLSANVESGGLITSQEAREWLTAFGRSPECKSYAQIQRDQEEYTFSVCGSRNTVIQASGQFSLPAQIPPGVYNRFRPLDYACCGNCTMIIPEVRLFYFPDQAAPQCEDHFSNSSAIVSVRGINKRVQSLYNTGSIAVLSGHTFTSPSVYLQVVGTAAVKDECGSFGPTLTNPIITLPPNVLSTYVPPNYSVGSSYTDPNIYNGPQGFVGRAEPLKIADLQCPTFGLGIGTSADGSVHTTVGPPWLPIIIPPPEVFTLDPTWESLCTDLASYYVYGSFAIFDPPFALTSESYLAAPPPATSSPNLPGPPNVPANPTVAYQPPTTYLPDVADPSSSPADSIAPSVDNTLPPQEARVNAAQPAAVPLDPAAKPTTAPDPPNQSQSQPQVDGSVQPGSTGLNSFIFDALGQSDPQPGQNSNADPTHIVPVPESGVTEVAVGGQTLSISASGVYLSGTSYSPGGPAITLPGGVLSLVSTSPFYGAVTPDKDPSVNDHAFAPSVQTIDGFNVVSNASGVYVAGSSLSPGGSAITASNTVIFLSPDGTLAIGSSSIDLSLVDARQTSPTKFDVAGVTVQAEPSAVVIDGITLKPGGPGTEINEKSISLEEGGALVVGTDRFVLPAAQETGTEAFYLDGMSFRLDSSAVLIDGTTLTPSGPAITIDGKGVSLEGDGFLDIGTSHFALPPAAQQTPANSFVLDGMSFQLDSSAVLIDGTTLTPGGPGITINGKPVSLEADGSLDIGTSHFALPPAAQQTPANSFVLDGMSFQSDSSAVVIDGTTLTPGGPGITINGKSVSLEGDGTLDIGTGRFAVPPAAQKTPANGIFLDGMTVQGRKSAAVVDGVTLVPGGPGTTINGSSVSLESGGTLDIGTDRFAISTVPVNGTASLQIFEGAQERVLPMSRLWGLAVTSLLLLWMVVY